METRQSDGEGVAARDSSGDCGWCHDDILGRRGTLMRIDDDRALRKILSTPLLLIHQVRPDHSKKGHPYLDEEGKGIVRAAREF